MDTLVLHLSSADFLYCLRLAKNILRGLENSIPKFFKKKNSSLPFIGLQKARKNDWRFGNFCCKLTSNLTLTGLYAGEGFLEKGPRTVSRIVSEANVFEKPHQRRFISLCAFV